MQNCLLSGTIPEVSWQDKTSSAFGHQTQAAVDACLHIPRPSTAEQLVCAEVTSIRLPNNTLTGSLPSSFSDLPLQVSPCFASGANTCLVWPGQNEDGIHCLCMPLGSQACSPTPPSPCQPTSLCAYTSSKRAPDQVLDVSTNAMSGHLDVLAPLTGLYELHTSNNVSLLCFGCGCLP